MGDMGLAEMCHVRVDEQSDAVFPSQLRPGSTQFDSVQAGLCISTTAGLTS